MINRQNPQLKHHLVRVDASRPQSGFFAGGIDPQKSNGARSTEKAVFLEIYQSDVCAISTVVLIAPNPSKNNRKKLTQVVLHP